MIDFFFHISISNFKLKKVFYFEKAGTLSIGLFIIFIYICNMNLGRLMINNGPAITDALRALGNDRGNDKKHLEVKLTDDEGAGVGTIAFDITVTDKTLSMAFKVLDNEGTIMGQVRGKQRLCGPLSENIECKYVELMYQLIDSL